MSQFIDSKEFFLSKEAKQLQFNKYDRQHYSFLVAPIG